jgi:hypothetical protein
MLLAYNEESCGRAGDDVVLRLSILGSRVRGKRRMASSSESSRRFLCSFQYVAYLTESVLIQFRKENLETEGEVATKTKESA